MKSISTRNLLQITGLLMLAGASSVQAANVLKLDTTSLQQTTANWVTAPAITDVGEFNGTPSVANMAALALGGNLTFGGLQFDGTMTGPATIVSGSTLTLTPAGTTINMTAANQNVTINCAVACGTVANTWNVASGRTLALGSTVSFGGGGTLILAGAGNFSLPTTTLGTGNGTGNIGVTTTGTVTVNDVNIGKTGSTATTIPTAASPVSAAANAGFYVSGAGAVVNLTTLELSTQNGGCSSLISAGATTVSGQVIVGRSSSGSRGMYFQISGGSFTANDTTTGLVLAPNNGAAVNLAELYVSGGTATVGKITFGAVGDTVGGTGFALVKGGTLYVGTGGVVRATTIGAYNATFSLFSGLLGATGNWSSSVPVALSGAVGTPFTIQAADAASVAKNISLSGVVSGSGSMTKTGGGTLTLSGANTYVGNTAINAGIVNAGVAEVASTSGPFGKPTTPVGSITFGGGTLQYSGANNNDYSGRFSTAGGQPISIDTAGQTVTFATALAGAGTSLTKLGSGTLSVTVANTYDNNTTNNGGTLNVNNPTGSGTGTGAVVVNSGGLLGGIGTISGAVTINSGGGLAPGNSVGTNTVGSLTLNAGSTNNFEFNANPANDQTIVTTSGGLVINGGVFNIYQEGGTTAYTVPGTYNLISYVGAISGTGTSGDSLDSTWTTASSTNPHIANPANGYTYQFGTSGGWVTLTIVSLVNNGTWSAGTDGNWSVAGNWTAVAGTMPPKNAADTATLGTASALRTVTLDASETVGTLVFNNANSFVIANSGNTLTLDNVGGGVTVSVTAGIANDVQTAVALNDNVTATVGSGKSLALSAIVSNSPSVTKALTVNGAGTTILSVANTYGPATAGTVGTTLSGGGTLQLGNSSALGEGDLNVTGSSTLKSGAAGLSIANNIAVGGGVAATVDNNGNNLTLGGIISSGGSLTKNSAGTLTLSGANTYTGGTTINAGTASIAADGASAGNAGNLGAVPASATPNNIILNGGDLLAAATLALHANRGIGIGATTGAATTTALVDAASGQTLTVNGVVASAGNTGVNNLTVNSVASTPGTVVLGGANTFGGTTVISAGTLKLGGSSALQSSTLNYNNQGGTLSFGTLTAATLGGLSGAQDLSLLNVTPAAVTLTVGGNNASTTYSGALSGTGASLTKAGAGTLTLTGNNSYTGTTTGNGGTLELPAGGVINGGALGGQGFLVDGGSLTSVGASSFNSVGNAFAESSGTVSLGAVSEPGTAGDGQLISITGGSFSATSLSFQRTASFSTAPTATAPLAAPTTSGLYVNGPTATVSLGALTISVSGSGSSAAARVDNGSVSVSGAVNVGVGGGGRWNILQVNGGTFSALDAVTGMVISQNSQNGELYLSGGTTTAGRIGFGVTGDASANGWLFVNGGASLYVGSGGIVKPVAADTATIELTSGLLGAIADWSSTLPMRLNGAAGTSFTIQAADASSVVHDISLGGILSGPAGLTKTGDGTLTLGAANTYSGATTISAGTLALSGSGSVTTPLISVANGATFDVSGVAFTLGGSQTLSNTASATGTLNGNVATGSGTVSVTYVSGTPSLTVTNGTLTLSAGTIFKINNTGSPLGFGSYKLISKVAAGNPGSVAGTAPTSVVVTGAGALSGVALQIVNGELYLNVGATTLALVSSAQTNSHNSSVTFTATVQTNGVTAGDATGTVQFETNGVAFGGPVGLTTGAVSTNLSTLPIGTNLITAIYSGDVNYLTSSNSLNQVVTNIPPVANGNSYSRGGLNNWKIKVTDLLANATDVDGDTLTLDSVTTSTNGIILVIGGGYVEYANANLVDDQFTYTVTDGFGGTNSGVITLLAGSATGVGGQISGFTANGGTASMTFAGIPGYKYHVQVSTDMTTWNDVWITNAPAGGVFQFTDGSAPQPDAFYRLMWNGN